MPSKTLVKNINQKLIEQQKARHCGDHKRANELKDSMEEEYNITIEERGFGAYWTFKESKK